jgi:hypothetical protein
MMSLAAGHDLGLVRPNGNGMFEIPNVGMAMEVEMNVGAASSENTRGIRIMFLPRANSKKAVLERGE